MKTKKILYVFIFSVLLLAQTKKIEFNEIAEAKPDFILNYIKEVRNRNPIEGLKVTEIALFHNNYFREVINKAKLIDEKGVLYKKIGNLDSSIVNHKKSLKLFESINDSIGISFALSNLGNIFRITEKYDLALNYYSRSLIIKEKLKDERQIAYTLLNMGQLFDKVNDLEKAMSYYNQALNIREKYNDEIEIANIYSYIAMLEKKKNKYENSKDFFNKALTIYKINNSFYGASEILIYLSEIDKYLGDLYNARLKLKEAEKYAENLSSFILKKEIYDKYSEYFYLANDYKKAYEYQRLSDSVKKIIHNSNVENKISEIELSDAIEKEQQENTILKLQLKQDRIIKNFLIIISILLVLIGLIIIWRYKERSKINKNVLQQKKELEELNSTLIEANNTKEKLFSIIAHDLRNPFGALMVFSEMLYTDYYSLNDNERKDYSYRIFTSSQRIYELLENLLKWALTQKQKIVVNYRNFNAYTLMQDIVSQFEDLKLKKNIKINLLIDKTLEISTDEFIMRIIMNNLITNALKFSHTNNNIEIIMHLKSSDKYEIIVKDYGVGMDETTVENIFTLGGIKSTRGTNNEQGTGLGLVLVYEFVNKLNGTIDIKSIYSKGSEFILNFPNYKENINI